MQIVAVGSTGDDLSVILQRDNIDVLLLDIQVPISDSNSNPYPILHEIKRILNEHPRIAILAISMYAQPSLIKSIMDAGASGYILKEDNDTIRELPSIIRSVARGGIHMSKKAFQRYRERQYEQLAEALSPRQIEALSLCAAYPDATSAKLADMIDVKHSTFRNTLSQAYLKLNVRTRAAAVSQARILGLISPGEE